MTWGNAFATTQKDPQINENLAISATPSTEAAKNAGVSRALIGFHSLPGEHGPKRIAGPTGCVYG